ncbi:unnamed protein product [Sphagnum jensenii]|uniref:Uncharacterized protein n=1 Tax=Sphagnum jensenii TaxID=128206 RepID=A0ABP1ATT8_9BRYO
MYLGCNSDTSVGSGDILFIKLGIKEVREELNLPPSSSHGSLVSLPGIFINCGILFGCIISFCLSGLAAHLSWCLMLGAGAVPAICLSLAVLLKTSHDKAEANDHLVEIMEAAGLTGSKLDA